MTPREELLRTGRLGEAGAMLLYETVRLVAIAHRFPPPEGHSSWDEADLQAVAHNFLQGDRGPRRLLDVATRSVDDRSFERILEAAVRNFFRDQARGTEFGKLIVRVKSVLRDEPEFVELPQRGESRWTLPQSGSEPSGASPAELAAATRNIQVVVPSWSSATRDAPLADLDSFTRLIRAVLVAAAGSLTAVDLAHALASRIDHRRTPLTVELDSATHYPEPASVESDPASRAVSVARATEIFDGLSDRERIIVATIDENVRDLGALIGTGKSQAAHLRQRLIDRMADELIDDDEPEETVSALATLCDDWFGDWTASADATSE